MPQFSKDEKLFFTKVIPQKIKKREYYDYSTIIMFLEQEYITAFDLIEDHDADDVLGIAESVVNQYLEENTEYLIVEFIVNNSSNIEHLLNAEDYNTEIFKSILLAIIESTADNKLIASIFSGGALTRNFGNIYKKLISKNDELIIEINTFIDQLEF